MSRRFTCPRCGLVRDVNLPANAGLPWCRHNALDLPADRMVPISSGHPLATGPLPWGDGDPSRSDA